MSIPPRPEDLLKSVFGFDEFKPLQREIITNVLEKKDTLAVMPTGGGKSLCYQIPALIFPGLTVVVSPLISLMKDQVEQLAEVEVPALFLNSSLSPEEYHENMLRVRFMKVKLLFVAPETLLTQRVLNLLYTVQLDCLTIDEAHCISEWGHDFRPEYRQLVGVRERFPDAVCLALTATATPRVREDIMKCLGFYDSNEFIASFDRKNLFIEVIPKDDPATQVIEFIQRFPNQSGIIYCLARRQVDKLAAILLKKGYSVRPYQAGLTDEERKQNQEQFIRDDVQIVVATIAFGMGINKPNVRFILHYDLPHSIESYYHEIGRSGRDGLPAHCRLLYSYGDVYKIKSFLDQKEDQERQVAYLHLNALVKYAESLVCRRKPLLEHFGEIYSAESCGMCDVCLGIEKNQVDITVPAQKFFSCVKLTGERFGVNHIVDVLLGSVNPKILKLRHNNLTTYGIGKDLTKKQWLHLSGQLLQKGYLIKDEKFGGIKLSPKAYDLLNDKERISGAIVAERIDAKAKKTGDKDYDRNLFDILRKKRKELADASHIPPYFIFSDKSLVEMATYYPMTPDNFKTIHGVGSVKLERYGHTFMEMITAYCQEHHLVARPKPKRNASFTPGQLELKAKHIEVGEAFNSGQTIQELMERFGVQLGAILAHLTECAMRGFRLRQGDEFMALTRLSPDQQASVMAAFEKVGPERLKPVFDELKGSVNYDDLKILRLYFLTKGRGEASGEPHPS